MKRMLIATFALVLLLTGAAWAQAPDTILYQGRFTDANGAPLAPPVAVTFSLWTLATGGASGWDSGELVLDDTVVDAQGMFTVELGPFPSSVFDGGTRWLEIQITGEAAMTPRQPIASVPYSLGTMKAGGASFVGSGGSMPLTSTAGNIISKTIDIPAAGYVYASSVTYLETNHSSGTSSNMRLSISAQSATLNNAAIAYQFITIPVSGYMGESIPVNGVFYFNSPGPKTLYLVGRASSGSATAFENSLSLIYVPGNYDPSKATGDEAPVVDDGPRSVADQEAGR